MSSNDVGSYEFKRSPSEMQMEERSAHLARSTSDGSAHNNYNNGKINNDTINNNTNPPTHRWSSVLGALNILPFASHMVSA